VAEQAEAQAIVEHGRGMLHQGRGAAGDASAANAPRQGINRVLACKSEHSASSVLRWPRVDWIRSYSATNWSWRAINSTVMASISPSISVRRASRSSLYAMSGVFMDGRGRARVCK